MPRTFAEAPPEPAPPVDSPSESAPQATAGEPMLYCPTCSTRLGQHKCKLFCAQCGYFMSCADYI